MTKFVTLKPAEYWKLMKLSGDVERAQMAAQLAAERAKREIGAAIAAREEFLTYLRTIGGYYSLPQDAELLARENGQTLEWTEETDISPRAR